MSIETEFLAALEQLNQTTWDLEKLKSTAISCMDLTLLDESASFEALHMLNEKANLHHVAAICVLPKHINRIAVANSVKLATVVNFPAGTDSLTRVISTISKVLAESTVNEIDYVFPYQRYLAGKRHESLAHCQEAYSLSKQNNATFKVILETGSFPNLEAIYALSCEVINNGCDFLKTSTGKVSQGATPAATFAMLKAIKKSNFTCGLKVSGGIKQPAQAFTFMGLSMQTLDNELDKSWFRIGASSLLDELIK